MLDRAAVARLGRRLGQRAVAGDVVALTGDLGAGKTFLARAIARGIGVAPTVRVTSPTSNRACDSWSWRVRTLTFSWRIRRDSWSRRVSD